MTNNAAVQTIHLHLLPLLLLLISFILISTTPSASAGLKFAEWSKPCKTGEDGSLVKPHEECEISKGMLCQYYDQGFFCGCQIKGQLTYDHVSKECRRKVGALCQPSSTPEEEAEKKFNHKCHTNAECLQLNSTSSSSTSDSSSTSASTTKPYLCLCKEDYYATSNLDECVSKSTSPAPTATMGGGGPSRVLGGGITFSTLSVLIGVSFLHLIIAHCGSLTTSLIR